MKRLFYSVLIAISLLLYNTCEKKYARKDKIYLFIPDAGINQANIIGIPGSVTQLQQGTTNDYWIDITEIQKSPDLHLPTLTQHRAFLLSNFIPMTGGNAQLYFIPDTTWNDADITPPLFAITTYK
ncbi:hypothetical protein ACT3CD_11340 [Geofilum sp. OHC36d9]|uniref:hypothetical protein n=1 Tax=Geofilum sp. OHC36d9 TaxID=3458413 RepID=UPI00403345B2